MNPWWFTALLAIALVVIILVAHKIIRDQQKDYLALMHEDQDLRRLYDNEQADHNITRMQYIRQGVRMHTARVALTNAGIDLVFLTKSDDFIESLNEQIEAAIESRSIA